MLWDLIHGIFPSNLLNGYQIRGTISYSSSKKIKVCVSNDSCGYLLDHNCFALVCLSISQANAASGMAIHEDCKLRFLELKTKRTHKFIVFKIEETQELFLIQSGGINRKGKSLMIHQIRLGY
ncbi:hypothetical protein HN51_048796 [Arachis hypogaea]